MIGMVVYAVIAVAVFALAIPVNKAILRYQFQDMDIEIETDRTILVLSMMCGLLWVVAPLLWLGMLANAWLCMDYGGYLYLDPDDAENLEDDEIDPEEDEYL